MSEFIYLFRSTPANQQEALGTPERAKRSMEIWLAWIRDLEAKGHLKHPGQPLDPGGTVVRGSTVTDGPYVEAKDLVLGFILVEARDLDEAVDLSRDCPIALGGGSVEVRPVGRLQAEKCPGRMRPNVVRSGASHTADDQPAARFGRRRIDE